MWYVVVDAAAGNPKEEDEIWTVSQEKNKPGWYTDGGYPGYGLTKAQATTLADAANQAEELKIYDIQEDEFRQVTREDLKRMALVTQAYGRLRADLSELLRQNLALAQGKEASEDLPQEDPEEGEY